MYNENNCKGFMADLQASSVALRDKQQNGKIDLWSQRNSLTFFVRLSEVVPQWSRHYVINQVVLELLKGYGRGNHRPTLGCKF